MSTIIKQTQKEELKQIINDIAVRKSNGENIELIFDTETTGFSANLERILELGVKVISNDKSIHKIHLFFNPWDETDGKINHKDVPFPAFQVHGIDRKMLEGGKNPKGLSIDTKVFPFTDYAEDIYNLFNDTKRIAHNIKFDIAMLNGEFKRSDLPYVLNEDDIIYDTQVFFEKTVTKEQLKEQGVEKYNLDDFIAYSAKINNKVYSHNRELHGALVDSEILEDAYLDNKYKLFSTLIKEKELAYSERKKAEKEAYEKIIKKIGNEKTQEFANEDILPEKELTEEESSQELQSNVYFKSDKAIGIGSSDIKEMVAKVAKSNEKKLIIMDDYKANGHTYFAKYSKEYGITALFGSSIKIKNEDKFYDLNLIATDENGYKDLMKIITIAYKEDAENPYIDMSKINIPDDKGRLVDLNNFLISTKSHDKNELNNLKEILINSGIKMDKVSVEVNADNKILSQKEINDLGFKVNITKEALYTNKADKEQHDILKRIVTKNEEAEYLNDNLEEIDTNKYYNKSELLASEKELLKEYNQETKINLENVFEFPKKRTIFPKYPIELGLSPEEESKLSEQEKEAIRHKKILEVFVEKAKAGLEERIKDLAPSEEKKKLLYERLETEIKVIMEMEEMQKGQKDPMAYAEYFLFVADYVSELKNNGVLVGPGRGSGAGSLIAYAMKITDVEVQSFDLIFERFINKERISEPDFDVDFAGVIEKATIPNKGLREYVLKNSPDEDEYIAGKDLATLYMEYRYPKAQVSKILTEGKLKPKGTFANITKMLGTHVAEELFNNNLRFRELIIKAIPKLGKPTNKISYIDISKYLSDLISDADASMEENINKNETLKELYNSSPIINKIIKMAQLVEGKIKNYGSHAGGLVADFELTQPMMMLNGSVVYQKVGKEAELVKFDFLGLKTLEVIENAKQAIKTELGIEIDFNKINYENPETYKLISQGNTKGVFQIESDGMRDLNKKISPSGIEDVIAILALYRPGPMDSPEMLPAYIERKNGAEVKYDLGIAGLEKIAKTLEPILEPTLGIPVYQEQVMSMMREIAGFSLGDADLVRRAMGKKDVEAMKQIKADFAQRANVFMKTKGIDLSVEEATQVFEKIEGFAGYGFNKSHSAAYGLLTFQTAYIKANYPAYFFMAHFNNAKEIEKLSSHIQDAEANNIGVLAPNINKSLLDFSVEGDNVRYGFNKIKGFAKKDALKIIKEREKGEFTSIENLFDRLKPTKGFIEKLTIVGAFDTIPLKTNEIDAEKDIFKNRINKLNRLYELRKTADKSKMTFERGDESEFYDIECDLLGDGITAKSILSLPTTIQYLKDKKSNLKAVFKEEKQFKSVVVLKKLIEKTTKANDLMAYPIISDGVNEFDAIIFAQSYENLQNQFKGNSLVEIEGYVMIDKNDGSKKIVIKDMKNILQDNVKTVENKVETNISNEPKAEIKENKKTFAIQKDKGQSVLLLSPVDNGIKEILETTFSKKVYGNKIYIKEEAELNAIIELLSNNNYVDKNGNENQEKQKEVPEIIDAVAIEEDYPIEEDYIPSMNEIDTVETIAKKVVLVYENNKIIIENLKELYPEKYNYFEENISDLSDILKIENNTLIFTDNNDPEGSENNIFFTNLKQGITKLPDLEIINKNTVKTENSEIEITKNEAIYTIKKTNLPEEVKVTIEGYKNKDKIGISIETDVYVIDSSKHEKIKYGLIEGIFRIKNKKTKQDFMPILEIEEDKAVLLNTPYVLREDLKAHLDDTLKLDGDNLTIMLKNVTKEELEFNFAIMNRLREIPINLIERKKVSTQKQEDKNSKKPAPKWD